MRILGLCFLLLWDSPATSNCVGRFVNPITDICWKCIFPITIAGLKVASGFEDTSNASNPVCFCKDPPRIGIPISFWEPVRLFDITRTPYCMVNLGGITMGPGSTHGRDSVGHAGKGHMQQSFYQVHWYVYPLIYWLELLVDFTCLEKATFDVAYITELDPLWSDDETSFMQPLALAISFGVRDVRGPCIPLRALCRPTAEVCRLPSCSRSDSWRNCTEKVCSGAILAPVACAANTPCRLFGSLSTRHK